MTMILRFAFALASCVAAAAFTPVARPSVSALKMGFESEIGAQPPLGFWDPLGLLNGADQERFDRLRYVENKHGRISMLAILGHLLITSGVRLPGEIAFGIKFADVPSGLKAFDVIPAGGIAQIIAFIGVIELGFNARQDEIESYCENNYADFTSDRRKGVELNNGRAAQMGILALMVHEKLDNNPYIVNSLLGAPVDFNAGF